MLPIALGAFTLALLTASPQTDATPPSGWTTLKSDDSIRFFFPLANDSSTFVAVFPTQPLDGSLQQTLASVWRRTIGGERLVDAQEKTTVSADGVPALIEVVATVDGANQGIYRVFLVKQYGDKVVSGEFRSDDPGKMQGVGQDAMRMLQSMSVRR